MLHVLPSLAFQPLQRPAQLADKAANDLVVALVAKDRKVPLMLLFHASRGRRSTAAARQLAMYLLHVVLGRSLTQVGLVFDRDRTTVSYACAAVEDLRDDPVFDAALDQLQERIEAALLAMQAEGDTDAH